MTPAASDEAVSETVPVSTPDRVGVGADGDGRLVDIEPVVRVRARGAAEAVLTQRTRPSRIV